MNRFAFVVCRSGSIEFVIPEINLRGSEPTENLDDVLGLARDAGLRHILPIFASSLRFKAQ